MRSWPTAARSRSARSTAMRRDGRCGEIVAGLGRIAAAERDEIARMVSAGAAPGRRLQPRRLPSAKRASVHRRRLGQSRAASGRFRGHARLVVAADAQLSCRCRGTRRSAWSTFRRSTRRWRRRSTSCDSKPTAVELVDRTMIDLARANPAFRPVIERALIGAPAAILLVEFSGDDAGRAGGEARSPGRADRRPRSARRGRADRNRAGAKGVVGSAQGRAQHHDVDERRRQAGLVHRGLRGAARAPGRIHRPADRGVPEARHQRHLVRARQRRHPARAADPRHASRRRGEDARDRRGSRGDGARIQGCVLGRARRRAVPRRVGGLAVRAAA